MEVCGSQVNVSGDNSKVIMSGCGDDNRDDGDGTRDLYNVTKQVNVSWNKVSGIQ